MKYFIAYVIAIIMMACSNNPVSSIDSEDIDTNIIVVDTDTVVIDTSDTTVTDTTDTGSVDYFSFVPDSIIIGVDDSSSPRRVGIGGDDFTVTDLSFLSHFTKTEYLYISQQNISDISFVRNMPNLKVLRLNWCMNVTDISPLESCTNMVAIDLEKTGIDSADLHSLKNMKNLKALFIGDNNINSLAGLRGLRAMDTIGIQNIPRIPESDTASMNFLFEDMAYSGADTVRLIRNMGFTNLNDAGYYANISVGKGLIKVVGFQVGNAILWDWLIER